MFGPVQFQMLLHVPHDNPHAGQSLTSNGAGALLLVPIPYAHCLDTVAYSVVARLLKELERDACVCVGQGEDYGIVEKRPQPCEEGVCPRLDSRRVGVPFVAEATQE